MKKKKLLSSYQKLKSENIKLKRDIHSLITNPNAIDTEIIKSGYQIGYNLVRLMKYGEYKPNKECKGILPFM